MKNTSNLLIICLLFVLLATVGCNKKNNPTPVTPELDLDTNQIYHDEMIRTYVRYVPRSYDGTKAVPLVIGLHGSGGTGESFRGFGLEPQADKYGFIVVYPDAYNHQWNIGNQYDTDIYNIDDVGFVLDVITKVSHYYRIDQSRVFVTGHSRGGYMAYHLACKVPDKIAAIGPVAGLNLTFTQPLQSRPVPIVHLHAKNDPTVPYYGQPYVYSVDSLLSIWRHINSCNSKPEIIYNQDGVTGYKWAAPETGADVELYSYEDGQHYWLPNQARFICDFFMNLPHTKK